MVELHSTLRTGLSSDEEGGEAIEGEDGAGAAHLRSSGSKVVHRGAAAAPAVQTSLPSALVRQTRGLSPSYNEGFSDNECDDAQAGTGLGGSGSSHELLMPSPWRLSGRSSLQLVSAAAAARPHDVPSSMVDIGANPPSLPEGSSVVQAAAETAGSATSARTAQLLPSSGGGSSTALGTGASVRRDSASSLGPAAIAAGGSAAADRGLVDAATNALALAARMRARLAACLNEQLEEARQRQGAATATAQQARSSAEEAAAGSQAVTAAGARAAGKREKAGRDAYALAARLAKEASAAASFASRLATSSATEAAADQLMSDASTAAAAASAEGADAAGRAATHATARVLALEAELAELASA